VQNHPREYIFYIHIFIYTIRAGLRAVAAVKRWAAASPAIPAFVRANKMLKTQHAVLEKNSACEPRCSSRSMSFWRKTDFCLFRLTSSYAQT